MPKYSIRRDSIARPFLAIFGATQSGSWVEIEGDALHVRLGALFDREIPLASVVGVERAKWPMWRGLGVRTSEGHGLGVVGSTEGVVRLRLSPRVKIKALFTFNCDELLVSLDDPDAFMRDVESALTARKSA